MTKRNHLKARVRARMEKTGERYAAARRHVLARLEASPPEPPAEDRASTGPVRWHAPGSVPAAAALRTLLAQARTEGASVPTEAMVFGVGGGVGVGVFAFRYEKEDLSSFFLGARHGWEDDLAWIRGACDRLGVAPEVRETGGARKAAADLVELLEAHGPVIAFVDMASLPHRAPARVWEGGGYHVLVVHAVEGDAAWVSDLAYRPYPVPIDVLAAARARIGKFRNRLVAISGPGAEADRWAAAAREGIAACVSGLTEGRMRSCRVEALGEWAGHLRGRGGKRSWPAMFRPGPNLLRALVWTYVSVELWGTGGGLARPMMGAFLREAGALLDEGRLAAAAAHYEALGRAWSGLADAALPSTVPAFAALKEAHVAKAEAFLAHGPDAAAEAAELEGRIRAAMGTARDAFPLDGTETTVLLEELSARVEALHAAEVEGVALLGRP